MKKGRRKKQKKNRGCKFTTIILNFYDVYIKWITALSLNPTKNEWATN